MNRPSALVLVGLLIGCGGAAPPAVSSPPSFSPPTRAVEPPAKVALATPSNPFAVSGVLHEETISAPTYAAIEAPLAAPPKGLAAMPAACAPFVGRKKVRKLGCDDVLHSLDTALAEEDEAKRDALLVDLETCTGLPQGVVRALRAEYAPLACGDGIAGPLVGKSGPTLEVQHALAGMAMAARLSRTVGRPPRLPAPYEKARVIAFIGGPLKDWMLEQAKLIEELSSQASRLRGYGMALAAVEAGVADLRFVDAVRSAPVPDALAQDPELKSIYESQLDQLLEPRKDRGRDAALAGLKELAALGVMGDARVARARALLGRMYAGRRIDALDALSIPSVTVPAPSSLDTAHRLAGRLPTFYVGALIEPSSLTDRAALSMMLARGVPPRVRARLKAEPLPDDVRVVLAQARLGMGRLYWRAVDFDEAAALAKAAGGDSGKSRDAEMLLALSLALRGGPTDAAHMMKNPPQEGLGLGDVAALDAVAKGGGPYAGMAAFDAAWIKRVGAPPGPNADYWRDVAVRFRNAEKLLDGDARTRAADAAREAEAISAETK